MVLSKGDNDLDDVTQFDTLCSVRKGFYEKSLFSFIISKKFLLRLPDRPSFRTGRWPGEEGEFMEVSGFLKRHV